MGRDITRKRVGMSVDRVLYEEVEKLSELTRVPKSRLIDEALEYLLQKYNIEIDDYEYRFKL